MVRVETTGLYHYEVIGEREKEAAAKLEETLDFLDRDLAVGRQNEQYYLADVAAARTDIEKEFSVEIRSVVG